jgi:hypothetical protein
MRLFNYNSRLFSNRMEQIKTVVFNQLSNAKGLYSLKLQNHIYGCFIIMEDIAQRVVDVSGSILTTPKFTFDFDKQFAEIGIRYGFAMDTKLVLEEPSSDYKNAWLSLFKDIDLAQDITEVDTIEDSLIEIIQKTVKEDDAFFVSALGTGSLPQEWIEKLLKLLNGSDEEIIESALTKANSEKPIRKRLAVTRRAKVIKPKKVLAKTRRH